MEKNGAWGDHVALSAQGKALSVRFTITRYLEGGGVGRNIVGDEAAKIAVTLALLDGCPFVGAADGRERRARVRGNRRGR